MVTPAGCPEYRYGVSCNEHLASCGGQAIVLDDSKKIRAYIEQVWGKITVLNAKGQPFEEPKR